MLGVLQDDSMSLMRIPHLVMELRRFHPLYLRKVPTSLCPFHRGSREDMIAAAQNSGRPGGMKDNLVDGGSSPPA